MTPIVQATATALGPSDDPDAIFGPRTTQEINWAAHDPATLVPNMRGMSLYAYTGDGRPGPLDPPEPNPAGAAIESGVHRLTQLWKANADAAQIPVEYHDYGPGTHTWPYWARDLRESVGDIDRDFAEARPAPAEKFFMSADAKWSQWGYDVELRRPAREFSTLRDGDADGFTLLGSGTGVVTTPAVYEPGASANVADRRRGAVAARAFRRPAARRGPARPRQPVPAVDARGRGVRRHEGVPDARLDRRPGAPPRRRRDVAPLHQPPRDHVPLARPARRPPRLRPRGHPRPHPQAHHPRPQRDAQPARPAAGHLPRPARAPRPPRGNDPHAPRHPPLPHLRATRRA